MEMSPCFPARCLGTCPLFPALLAQPGLRLGWGAGGERWEGPVWGKVLKNGDRADGRRAKDCEGTFELLQQREGASGGCALGVKRSKGTFTLGLGHCCSLPVAGNWKSSSCAEEKGSPTSSVPLLSDPAVLRAALWPLLVVEVAGLGAGALALPPSAKLELNEEQLPLPTPKAAEVAVVGCGHECSSASVRNVTVSTGRLWAEVCPNSCLLFPPPPAGFLLRQDPP